MGRYKISVIVVNDCTLTSDNVIGSAIINVKPNLENYPMDTSGDFKIVGKDCFDISESNFGGSCGLKENRPGDFFDSSRNWVEGKEWFYSFKETRAVTNLEFVTDDPSVLIKSEKSDLANKRFVITFDKSVLQKALGRDRTNALKVYVYALFKVDGINKSVKMEIKVQDCQCGCGAYISPTIWRNVMCHNLGADESLDPLVPAKGLRGAKYKFGSKIPVVTMEEDIEIDIIPNYTNIGKGPANGPWTKENDPCPSGYHVPTYEEWRELIANNTVRAVGSWVNLGASYTGGYFIGDQLFIHSAGLRSNTGTRPKLFQSFYWTSSMFTTGNRWYATGVASGLVMENNTGIGGGMSVRCISDL